MKPSLLFYSDCPVFGGADMLVAHMLNDAALVTSFETALVYRRNDAFESGVDRHIPKSVRRSSVEMPDRIQWIEALEPRWGAGLRLSLAKAALRTLDLLLFPFAVIRLSSEFRLYSPSVLHVNDGGYPGALGCRAAVVAGRLLGAKVVLAVHNQTRPVSLPADFMDLLVDPLVSRCADALVTASKLSQDSLAQRLPREKMRVILDGVPTPSGLRPATEVRRELGLAPTDTAFVMTAFFEPRKGHAVLIEAARLLMNTRLKFVLIGSGPEEAAAKRAVADAGLNDSFMFLGYRPDHGDILNACDALVLPSIHSEDMPLVILDAMALGKPVISTLLAGIPDEVENGVSGMLSQPGDAAGLAAALKKMSEDAALRRAMGDAGRKRFAERFTASAMGRRYRDLYLEPR